MIEGLKVTVSGTELRELCHARAEHHRNRAAQYDKKLAVLEPDDSDSEAGKMAGLMGSTTANPAKQLQERRNEHVQQAEELTFIAKHLDTDERYLLDREDLQRIGVVAGRYFGI